MPDAKFTDLPALADAPDAADLVAITDVSDVSESAGGTSKRVTIAELHTLIAQENPAAPAADRVRIFAKNICGRVLPKWMPPTGVDTVVQGALFGNNVLLWAPATGTTAGTTIGTTWTSGGTVSHPTPTAGIYLQMKRTRWANVATTQNQQLGILSVAPAQFWRGNAAGLGGFFFMSRFGIGLYPAATIRLFVGLTSLATSMVASDTPAGDFVGLWHDTTDAATVLSLITMNGTTRVKTTIAGTPTLAAGQGFDFYLFAPPNHTGIFYRLVNLNTGAEIFEGEFTGASIPRNTIFMNPQALMSNGTANTAVTTTAFELNRIYIESDI